ncbi:MAG TPA: TMEM165/GDT1 family protein [Mycobacteriales bacterium]
MDFVVVGIVFGVIFISELPDKSLFASLVLGTRYRGLYVWVGVAAAFLVHVVIAVAAGQVLTLLPHRLVEAIVAALFLAGAAFLLLSREQTQEAEGIAEGAMATRGAPSFRRVALTSFGVVFVGEWGDITQIVTANYAARYADPISVGLGAVLGLWAVAGLAIGVGSKLLDRVPVSVVRRVTGVILLGFAAYSAYSAVRG